MNALRIITFAAVGFSVSCAVAQAEPLPSFGVELCTWDAMHIVEVTQTTKRDGVCTVVASWKGELKKDDVLTFPELRGFSAEEQRRIFVFREMKVLPKRITHISGLRMVLFLKKGAKGPGEPDQAAPWRGAGWGPGVETSVAWIDGGETFAFMQVGWGGQVVWPLDLTEKQFKDRVLKITETKEKLRQVLDVKDPGERAESLANLLGTDLRVCQREAVAALGLCGEKGLPVVRNLLKEKHSAWIAHDLIRAMGKIGGPKAGKELVALLDTELVFWKKRGPQLKKDWWHDWSLGEKEVYDLRDRNGMFVAILGALGDAKYPECRPLVREVRDFLKAHPQLDTGAMRMCRVILAEK